MFVSFNSVVDCCNAYLYSSTLQVGCYRRLNPKISAKIVVLVSGVPNDWRMAVLVVGSEQNISENTPRYSGIPKFDSRYRLPSTSGL